MFLESEIFFLSASLRSAATRAKYLMKIQDVLEARKNPELNPKQSTWRALDSYWGRDLYLHFNRIEKVGVNLQSTNTWGPWGVYTFPIQYIEQNPEMFQWAANHVKGGFLHILAAKPGIRVLRLAQISEEDIAELAKELENITGKSVNLGQGTAREQWRDLMQATSRQIRTHRAPAMTERPQTTLNKILRRAGWDAVHDDSQLLNDNPNQQVFLHGSAYTLIKTIPIRRDL